MHPRRTLPALLLVFALLAASCGDDSGSSAPPVDTVAASSSTTSTTTTTTVAPDDTTPAVSDTSGGPATAPLDELEAEIRAAAQEWMTAGDVATPGLTLTVLLPEGGEIRIAEGVADIVAGTPVTTDDFFRIGSISKTVTTVAVLQLVEQGLIDLDATVATYLGEGWLPGYTLDGVEYGDRLTVREILNHTDGFAEFAWDPGFFLQSSTMLDQVSDPQGILDWAVSKGPQYVPGTDYAYNTVGHVVAGLVIEAVTGRPANEVIREGIFDPVGVGDAIFLPPLETPPTPAVHGYATGSLKTALDALPAIEPLKEAASAAGPDYYDVMVAPQDFLESVGWTGGGIEARSAAVAAIFRAMFDGTLLSPASLEEFTTPSGLDDKYALGLTVTEVEGHRSYQHGGGVPGFRSHAAYLPDLDVAIAMSANAVPIDPDVGALAKRIVEIVTSAG